MTKASGKKSSQKANSRAGSPGVDDLEDAEAMQHGDEERKVAADEEGQYDDDQAELDKKNENPLKDLFIDPKDYLQMGTKQQFDPKKKFGIIESESLLYDNVTTSYPLNLPTDHYDKYIKNNPDVGSLEVDEKGNINTKGSAPRANQEQLLEMLTAPEDKKTGADPLQQRVSQRAAEQKGKN